VDGALVSKIDGGQWALGRLTGPDRELVTIALDRQRCLPAAEPDTHAVRQFVQPVPAIPHRDNGSIVQL
jgi:streptomycin 3"-adenylyltransferase